MKLITWNIQWGRGADGRVDLDRIAAQARAFADFDVLCLQEVSDGYPGLPGGDGADQFAALAVRFAGLASRGRRGGRRAGARRRAVPRSAT